MHVSDDKSSPRGCILRRKKGRLHLPPGLSVLIIEVLDLDFESDDFMKHALVSILGVCLYEERDKPTTVMCSAPPSVQPWLSNLFHLIAHRSSGLSRHAASYS